jgi:hypothetical protein
LIGVEIRSEVQDAAGRGPVREKISERTGLAQDTLARLQLRIRRRSIRGVGGVGPGSLKPWICD